MAIARARTVSIEASETLRQAQERLAREGLDVPLQTLQAESGIADPDQLLSRALELSVFVEQSTDRQVSANLSARQPTSVAAPSSAFSMQVRNVADRAGDRVVAASASSGQAEAGERDFSKMNLAEAVAEPGFAAWDPGRIDAPQLQQIVDLLKGADSVLLVGHIDPDGDCAGSTLSLSRALRALGKRVDLCIDDEIPGQLAKVDTEHEIQRAADLAARAGDGGWDLALIMDVGTAERIGEADALLVPRARAVAIADHHVVDPRREEFQVADGAPFVAWVEPELPAAALQTAAMLARLDDGLSAVGADTKEIYTPALVGFATDTGFGRYPSLDRDYFRYFKHMMLESARSSMDELSAAMAFELSQGIQARLLGEPDGGSIPPEIAARLDALEAAGRGPEEELFYGPSGEKALAVLTCDERYLEVLKEAAHAESNQHPDDQLATIADLHAILKWTRMGGLRRDQRDVETGELVEAGFPLVALLTEGTDGAVHCELRSRDDSALELATKLGGGGHQHAAGATRPGSMDEVRAEILAWAAPRLEDQGFG